MIALFVLVGVTLLAIAAARTSVMELRMASNSESRIAAHQTTMAAVDFSISDSDNLPTVGPLNTPATVSLTPSIFAGGAVNASASRTQDCRPPPRARQANSLTAYSAFEFVVSADTDKTATGLGKAGMRMGYILLGPKC